MSNSTENTKISGRRWLLIFFLIALAGIAAFMGFNYYADVNDYFAVERGKDSYDPNKYARAVKVKYTKANKDSIDAAVVGGSKAGVLHCDVLDDFTGMNYYNFYTDHGNFKDYERYIRFLVEKVGVKEITLHISSSEVRAYDLDPRNIDSFKFPAVAGSNPFAILKETLGYLTTNVVDTVKEMDDTSAARDPIDTGERNWEVAIDALETDPDAFVKKTFSGMKSAMRNLFDQVAQSKNYYYDESLGALKRIVKYCDENDVELNVFIGAASVKERYRWECEDFYEFIRGVVDTCGGVWDFSSYSDINMNPYNFYDYRHYSDAIGDLELAIIYGTADTEDFGNFGTYLTAENVDDYIEQRREDVRELEEEFEENGSIELPGMDDPSYITEEDVPLAS